MKMHVILRNLMCCLCIELVVVIRFLTQQQYDFILFIECKEVRRVKLELGRPEGDWKVGKIEMQVWKWQQRRYGRRRNCMCM
jgi:hypothetical protein